MNTCSFEKSNDCQIDYASQDDHSYAPSQPGRTNLSPELNFHEQKYK